MSRDPCVGRSVLITGGTGSFGRAMAARLLQSGVQRLVVFSRDELKQFEMRRQAPFDDARMRWFLGDIRDRERLRRALAGVDVVIHAAALKQVPACEYNPFEAVLTNVVGAQNLIEASLDCGVQRVVALSTDKACNPVNLYGATKLCSDKLFVAGNHYAGEAATRFSVVRYGNVIGSRGSVIPLFLEQRAQGKLTVTHQEMTRFWITLEQGVAFVHACLGHMQGGEIFVPKIPSMRVWDLAEAIAPGIRIEEVGIRPGEKLHETMVSEDDARLTLDMGAYYRLLPAFSAWGRGAGASVVEGRPLPPGFRYSSETNAEWLTPARLREIVREFDPAAA